jgi:hypothetical protein
MAQNQYLASQLSGPYAQALINAIENEITLASGEISYMYNLSINNSLGVSGTLGTIGELVGYLWPVVPAPLVGGSGLFTFCTVSQAPSFITYSGFGSVVSGTTLSGLLTTYYASSSIGYQEFESLLPIAAQIKNNGITFATVDEVCQILGPHTIGIVNSGVNVGDITVHFSPYISSLNLYLGNELFSIFTTEPQVLLYNG